MSLADKKYDKKIVIKPWGYEYVAFREKNDLGITFLNINYKKKTSLHCHPNKKTGFILLNGKAKIQLGLWQKDNYTYNSPSKLMIRPDGANSFKECMRMSYLVIQKLKKNLEKINISTSVGDEGGFAPSLKSDEEAIEFIIKSIEAAGFEPGKDVSICLDVAANELKKPKSVDYYVKLASKYHIKSIEDPFSEDDWNSSSELTSKTNIQIVGDDIFATNIKRLKKGITEKSANAILIKPNQIGTISETLDAIKLAHENKFKTVISHRSGDSEDTFIADLAVATNSSQIKTGSLSRSERISKYNRLLRIEEELGNSSKMAKI